MMVLCCAPVGRSAAMEVWLGKPNNDGVVGSIQIPRLREATMTRPANCRVRENESKGPLLLTHCCSGEESDAHGAGKLAVYDLSKPSSLVW